MSRSYKAEGIVIKRKNFSEADRILTVLTREYGKIQVKAPGVRKITSRRSSHIELLNFSAFTLYKSSRGYFPIVTEAKAIEEFFPIKNTLSKVGLSYYMCELIDNLCAENQDNKKAFFLLKDTLFTLSHDIKNDIDTIPEYLNNNSSIVEDFENQLLVALGFLPQQHTVEDTRDFIENILERKLKTKRVLHLFAF